MTLDLSAALEQIEAIHDDNLRLAEIDCERCNHRAIVVVRFDAPETLKCPKCGAVLDLLNDDEIDAEVAAKHAATNPAEPRPGWIEKRQTAATELADYRTDWLTQVDVERIWNEAEPEAY